MKRQRHSDHDYESKRKRIALFGSIFMVAILLFSTFAYYMTSNTQTDSQMSYGDYEFAFKDLGGGNGVLVTQMNGQEIEFQGLPTQTTYLEVDPLAIMMIQNAAQIVLAADPNATPEDASTIDYARLQLGLAIPKMANAMTKADERYQLPVVSCLNATAQTPVIEFDLQNDSRITTSGYCITMHAQQRELLLLKDRIIFEYYGILKDGQVVE